MAEEEPKTTETPPAAPAAVVENKEGTNGKQRGGNRGDTAPVEEMFDLSKPIPRVSGTNDYCNLRRCVRDCTYRLPMGGAHENE
jgi:hypothetical protein